MESKRFSIGANSLHICDRWQLTGYAAKNNESLSIEADWLWTIYILLVTFIWPLWF
jgi:hypothetical protein